MAYVKTNWKPRQGTGLNKFTKHGETANTVYLENTPDSITEQGTEFSAEKMNRIEDGIGAAHTLIAQEEQARQNADQSLQAAINSETERAGQAEANLDNAKIDKAVAGEKKTLVQAVKVKEITSNGFIIAHENINVENGAQSETEFEMPQASEASSGIMPAESFRQIAENTSRINRLESRAIHYSVTLETDTPAQADLQAAYEEVSGNSGAAPDQTTLDDTSYGKSYAFYESQGSWADKGNTTVAQFSNSAHGLMKGSNEDGKVFAEQDGTGSVAGWTELKTKVANNESAIEENSRATLTDQAESNTLPAITSTSITLLLQTIRNGLKWLVNQMALKANASATVNLTGAQTVAGVKTFSSTPVLPAATGAITAAPANSTTPATTRHVYDSISTRAPLASPALTGTPTAPTAAAKTNNTQIATTAYADRAAHPVGAFYTQFPVSGQSTFAGMFPSSASPATLFGGTWTEQFDTEEVSFRTPGTGTDTSATRLGVNRGKQWNNTTKAFETGTAGIEPDAVRNITGNIDNVVTFSSYTTPIQNGVLKAESGQDAAYSSGAPVSGYRNNISIDGSRQIPTDTQNRVKNRLIRVWKKTA